MEVVRSHRKLAAADDVVPTLPLYRSAPALEVRLEDFELYAIDRLRVLKGISDGLSRGKKPDEMEKLVSDLLRLHMRHPQASEAVNKDLISHFVLRLVYCRTEDLRKWFLSMETTLFRYRFRFESPEAQRALMAEFHLSYKAVSGSEYENVKDKLVQVARSIGQSLPTVDAIFYKVPFEEVPELVASRRVYIQKGHAYVAMNQVVSLVGTQFRSLLSKALVLTNSVFLQKMDILDQRKEKDRLTPIVESLSSSYLGPDYSEPREFTEISLKDIDQVAKSSFPLCMRHLFEKLREDHHLKHGGRMQLGLFLKGVGLKLDDALAFWKEEFSERLVLIDLTKNMHTAYDTIMEKKGREHEENLRAALGKMGVSNRALEDVIDKVRHRHYQLACTLTFEAVHGFSCDAGINHPNQYFSDSKKILESRNNSGSG